jgi:hypothetical protein
VKAPEAFVFGVRYCAVGHYEQMLFSEMNSRRSSNAFCVWNRPLADTSREASSWIFAYLIALAVHPACSYVADSLSRFTSVGVQSTPGHPHSDSERAAHWQSIPGK